MHTIRWLAAIVIALGVGLTSCEKAPDAGKKVFVMVPKGVHPYYGPCWQGFQDAAKKYGVEVKYSEPTKFDLPLQIEVLENVIATKPAGIAISAKDDKGLKNIIDKAAAAGIKVITFDAPAFSTKQLTYIGTANDKAGYEAGLEMAKAMNYEGEIAFLEGGIGTPNLDDRFDGFKKALEEKAPKIKIVAREDTFGLLEQAVTKTENIVTTHPDIKGIFGLSGECLPGIATVLKRVNKPGIVVAGFDDSPEAIAAIKAGTCQFCIAQRTYKMGWMSVEKLLDACNGKPLEPQYDTGVVFVKKDNVDTYMKDAMAEYSK